jgi:tetratricopeptide (TPR) repeat protein
MVLALARPEVFEVFPRLWAERQNVQELRLKELGRKAGERLVRQVLGDAVGTDTVERLVKQADGNAFYLEELIRAVAEGKDAALPETVLAMVETRLARLPHKARRVLRAASVFGEVFWSGAAAALVGAHDDDQRADVDRCLAELARAELVTPRPESRIAGDIELVFRHALVREAAYAALTDADRTLGHRLAADWLEAAGLRDALTLAEHRSRGADLAKAIPWYLRAAEQALEGNDYESALERVERARKAGASGAARGAMELIAAEAHKWRGDWAAQAVAGLAAMTHLGPGSPAWCSAVTNASFGAGRTGDRVVLATLVGALREAPVQPSRERVMALVGVATDGQYCGIAAGVEIFAQALAEGQRLGATDPFVAAVLHRGRAFQAYFAGDTAARLDESRAAALAYQAAGAVRLACGERLNFGTALADLGAFDEAAATLIAVVDEAERAGLASIVNYARTSLGCVLTAQGRLADAAPPLERALAQFIAEGNHRNETGARDALARLHLERGDLVTAEREAKAAAAIEAAPPLAAHARATLARVLVAAGRTAEALAALVDPPATPDLHWLGAHAEALAAAGRTSEARDATARAIARRDAIASRIGDPRRRELFRTRLPESARLAALEATLA